MAKYTVKEFSVSINENDGYPNISLNCHLTNSSNNPSVRNYIISSDTRFPDIDALKEKLNNGFSYASENGFKVEISEFKERTYLFIDLPKEGGKDNIQVTGKRV